MKTLLNLTFLLAFCTFVSAQKTDSLKSKSSLRLFENKLGGLQKFEAPKAPISGFGSFNLDPKPENIFPFKLPELSISPKKEINMMYAEEFADNGARFDKSLNKSEGNTRPGFKSDQYLGDFKTTAKRVVIICRDFGEIDGDRVRLLMNDIVIEDNIHLVAKYYAVELDLDEGFNRIDFQALNQGYAGPNTAEFKVLDEQGKVLSANQWNLTTGIKATLIIIRQ
jgi:hypothetical protein